MQAPASAVEQWLQSAIQESQRGNGRGAAELCQQILAQQPNHDKARYLLALILLQAKQLDAGMAELRRILAEQPQHAGARYSLGKAHALKGEAEEAAQHLELAIAQYPEGAEAYVELARLRAADGQADAAEGLLREALKRAPEHDAVLNNLATHLAEQGRADEAKALYERALETGDRQPLTHFNLAKLLRNQNDIDGAVAHYEKAVGLRPDFIAAWHNFGNLLLDLGQVDRAAHAFRQATAARRRPGAAPGPDSDFGRTSATKLQHDIEQFSYLIERGIIPERARQTVELYRNALASLPVQGADSHVVDLPAAQAAAMAPTYNRLVHWDMGAAVDGPAVNSALDARAIEADYAKNAPGITYADGFLSQPALEGLRRFCLNSTIWYTYHYANGYLGALMDDGFCCPLLLQIAEEMRSALPAIFKDHTLRKLWAFKYDSRLAGIPVHGDFAAVNVNFWLTPDEANLNPETGGLIVWDKEAPLDWDFESYNVNESKMRNFLADNGAKSVNVPHRQNRVVIFNSDLFHETGPLDFKPGYENRRINVTMLFGKREHEPR